MTVLAAVFAAIGGSAVAKQAAPLSSLRGWDANLPTARGIQRGFSSYVKEAVRSGSLQIEDRTTGPLEACPVPPQAVLPLPSPLPNEIQDLVSLVKTEFDALFAKSNATGGVVSMVYGDQVLLNHGYGAKKVGERPDVDSSTVFRIGSISKVFTDLMMFRLAEDGKVSVDDPVTKHEPHYAPKPANYPTRSSTKGATLRDLGSHMAGLPRYMPCTFGETCNITLAMALKRINEWNLLYEPGEQLMYSNTGFALLGRILEHAQGETYEQSLEELAHLMGMEATKASPPDKDADLAYGYAQGGQQVPIQDLGISNPAGGVYSTGGDMATFMSFLLRDAAARDDSKGQVLDSNTVRSWLKTRAFVNPSNIPSPSLYYTEWGVPWQVLRANLDSVSGTSIPAMANFSRFYLITKDGSVPGYNSQMVLQPELKLGIFAAMTTGATRDVPFFSDTVSVSALVAVPRLYQYLSSLAHSHLPPSPSDYVGSYSVLFEGVNVSATVVRDESGSDGSARLYIKSTGLGFPPLQPIDWVTDDVFRMAPDPSDVCFQVEAGILWVVRFVRKVGKVDSLVVEGQTIYPLSLHRDS